jgi:hypothetical protein
MVFTKPLDVWWGKGDMTMQWSRYHSVVEGKGGAGPGRVQLRVALFHAQFIINEVSWTPRRW